VLHITHPTLAAYKEKGGRRQKNDNEGIFHTWIHENEERERKKTTTITTALITTLLEAQRQKAKVSTNTRIGREKVTQ
jgi:hypothetical protein